MYEPIMVEGFKKKHGMDPRELDESDPRWLDYMAEVTTEFVRLVKESLPGSQRLSVMVPGMEKDCRTYGLDLATWLEQRLIDDLIPAGIYYDEHDVHIDAPDSLNFEYFVNLEKRETVRLIPMLYPWGKFQRDFAGWLKLFEDYTEMGADAVAVWDAVESDRYRRVEYVGDMEKYKKTHRYDFKRIQLKTLQGFRVDRYHYFEGI